MRQRDRLAFVIEYRHFLNTDPPLLVDVWRRQRRLHPIADRVNSALFEELIFSKPYFDPSGLILAIRDNHPLGFAHASFGPNQDRSDVDPSVGILSTLRVGEGEHATEVGKALLEKAIAYLVGNGAKVCHVGSQFPYAPFYLGLYGGSRIPGVLSDDTTTRQALQDFGFREIEEILIFQRQLSGFRALVDRKQMAVRRQYHITASTDPDACNWWEACTLGPNMRTRFTLTDRKCDKHDASVMYWDMQPLSSCWGVCAMGLYDLMVSQQARRTGLGTFLVCESLRTLAQQGVTLVEAQIRQLDDVACKMFGKLGFEKVGSGVTYELDL